MPLDAGSKVGPYEILAPIGAGGMGEVYRARDTRLKREVALKVLPEAFARDPERLVRFQREAELLASLNHPNIAHIYGVEERALAMELVEGQTLPCPLPVDTALGYARQIAEALEYAHERGVIHRDLKPANVKVTAEGVVKLLDFGLAKAVEDPAMSTSDPENSPTLTLGATRVGMILGTAAYMAPEQASGKTADRRSDIWSFGALLYEMLAGKRAFAGDSVSDTLATVLKLEPEWNALPKGTPGSIRKLLERCLTKDRRQRLQAIGEARIALEHPSTEPEPAAPSRPRATRIPWMVAAVATLALAALATVHLREAPPEALAVRTAIVPPENAAFDDVPLAISPDGKTLVFAATVAGGKSQLWIRPLDSPTAQPLPGTEDATFPFWSPDSRFVAFFAGGKLKKIDVSGGPAVTLADAPRAGGGSWSPVGVLVFSGEGRGPLQQIPSGGGSASAATGLDRPKGDFRDQSPWFLPDGQHFLYFSNLSGVGGRGGLLKIGSINSQAEKTLGEGESDAIYADGHLLFRRAGTLMAQPFDLKGLTTTGDAVAIAPRVQGAAASGVWGLFAAAGRLLAYRIGSFTGLLKLTVFDRNGKPTATIGDPAGFNGISLSPDGKSVAAHVSGNPATGNHEDIWIYELTRALRTPFTSNPAEERNPVWSPDGRTIVFGSDRSGTFDLYRKASDGAGTEELLYADALNKWPRSWSEDGKFLLYDANGDPKTGHDVWVLPMSTGSKPFPFLHGTFNERSGQFSPDGHWVAYESDEGQRSEVYVTPFPGPGGKTQISTNGGFRPRWRADGKELFYIGPDQRLMSAAISLKGDSVQVGEPHSFNIGPLFTNRDFAYDVSPDGQHIVAVVPPEAAQSEPWTLVQNWTASLNK